ncbi:hypothetical protein [Propionispora sp. 2/2-37]|uniref:hypothetical protein n=1 Tax=Propionispora sp. 2/2-37 TaxID=1677858 RepID=UPI0012E1FE57|nr:hypothetical protein [Propionispora sp. 2/2-37]
MGFLLQQLAGVSANDFGVVLSGLVRQYPEVDSLDIMDIEGTQVTGSVLRRL